MRGIDDRKPGHCDRCSDGALICEEHRNFFVYLNNALTLYHPMFQRIQNNFSPHSTLLKHRRGNVQAKLEIGPVNDPYEQEADAMADHVMQSTPLTKTQAVGISAMGSQPPIQRAAAHESPSLSDVQVVEEENGGTVQRRQKPGQQAGGSTLSQSALQHGASVGTSLPPSTRNWMEQRMNANFANVRIHHGEAAAQYSDAIQARAFTYGNDIYFNRGEYQPETSEGKHLLAHELTHVIQQGGGKAANDHCPSPDNLKIQRMRAKGRLTQSGVAPWRGSFPIGDNYEAQTDAGSTVTVWQAAMVYQDQYRYWCHGHSLGTYNQFDYSVYSGGDMATAIRDEWTNIPPASAQAGDLAVWTNGWNHSAKFVTPVVTGGNIDPNASTLSTKNGQNALTNMSLTGIMGVYGPNGIAVYRHI